MSDGGFDKGMDFPLFDLVVVKAGDLSLACFGGFSDVANVCHEADVDGGCWEA